MHLAEHHYGSVEYWDNIGVQEGALAAGSVLFRAFSAGRYGAACEKGSGRGNAAAAPK